MEIICNQTASINKQCKFSFLFQPEFQQQIEKIHVPTRYMDESEIQNQRPGRNLLGVTKVISEMSGQKRLEKFQQLISSKLSLNAKGKDDLLNNPGNAVKPMPTKQDNRLKEPNELIEKPSSLNTIEELKEKSINESQTSKTMNKTVANYYANPSSSIEFPRVFTSKFKKQEDEKNPS